MAAHPTMGRPGRLGLEGTPTDGAPGQRANWEGKGFFRRKAGRLTVPIRMARFRAVIGVSAESEFSAERDEGHNFPIVFRGYDRDEVDAYIAQLEAALQLPGEVDETDDPAELAGRLGQEMGDLLASAQRSADLIRAEAQQAAEDLRSTAAQEAEEKRRLCDEETAQRRAEAAEDAERTLQEAKVIATRLENAAKQQHADMLHDAVSRMRDLEDHERQMLDRLESLEIAFKAFRRAVDENYAGTPRAGAEDTVLDLRDEDISRNPPSRTA
jgi:DivIVA domain-containing protein